MNTDRIEKKVLLHAPLERVWNALSDSSQFGTWFGVDFEGPFQEGATVHGTLVTTKVDAEVAAMQDPHKGKRFELTIEQMKPGEIFSFRWHPHAADPAVDYSKEPQTLVAFHLEQTAEGVLLTVTESGFDNIPLERRATAFTANEQGWSIMTNVIKQYVERYVQAKA